MVQILVSSIIILLMLLIGSITQAYKKIIKLLVNAFYKITGKTIKYTKRERHITSSKSFKETYKGITKVKKSKSNLKPKSSFNKLAILISIISLLLIIINLETVTGNSISKFLYSNLNWIPILKSEQDVNTIYTAIMFSSLSFGLTTTWGTWKSTKEIREYKTLNKMKKIVIDNYTSKELYQQLIDKEKDSENQYKEN